MVRPEITLIIMWVTVILRLTKFKWACFQAVRVLSWPEWGYFAPTQCKLLFSRLLGPSDKGGHKVHTMANQKCPYAASQMLWGYGQLDCCIFRHMPARIVHLIYATQHLQNPSENRGSNLARSLQHRNLFVTQVLIRAVAWQFPIARWYCHTRWKQSFSRGGQPTGLHRHTKPAFLSSPWSS